MDGSVLVAMSGGVDSSAAAALLLESGTVCAGGTLLLHELPSAGQAVQDAADAAARLGIPHYVFDRRSVFRQRVIDEFAFRYIDGLTPNPCVICNRSVKFPELLSAAEKLGFSHLATGHYAQISYDFASKRWILKKGLDKIKDQSYFLYGLTQEMLPRIIFPLGGLTKAQVRELARDLNLPAVSRPESQDVCFIPTGGDYRDLLCREYGVKPEPGDFIDESGMVLGRHSGRLSYTVGQRRGLGVSASGRLYVLATDAKKNRVILGPEASLLTNRVAVRDFQPGAIGCLDRDFDAQVKLRYSRTEVPARVHITGYDTLLLELREKAHRPAPGQAAVLYDGDVVLGGGEITDWGV